MQKRRTRGIILGIGKNEEGGSRGGLEGRGEWGSLICGCNTPHCKATPTIYFSFTYNQIVRFMSSDEILF